MPSEPPRKPMNTGLGSLSFLQGSPYVTSELVWGNRNIEGPSAKTPVRFPIESLLYITGQAAARKPGKL